ncbi:diaminopropionate ammonia-lyase [Brevibacterium spongiae]|uniref:Diaminopropionate ammonia-lyase n=1 Tax=Brevibacterium spongiae TaxID=2909672 RepID=A0ABY5SNQ7_9MICO|nr:diaminopropionate ammonia-lyase [Brevibacterium spongiae]UVI36173.1 diaminopropionate ammonia-lyase [Brevibacterium spongiae]
MSGEKRLWLRETPDDGTPDPQPLEPKLREPQPREPQAFHRTIPGYRVTDLIELPALAAELGVASVRVKDESDRFGLPAFKALGASWAVDRAISARLGLAPAGTFTELCERTRGLDLRLVTASDGNHGRALARIAALLGVRARVVVPAGLPRSTLDAIRGEGAEVIDSGLVYDRAVELAANGCGDNDLLVQDTAWPGYEDVPGWIVEGYSTLFAEVEQQLGRSASLMLVPTGVGSLLQSAVEQQRRHGAEARVLAVEPVTAACVCASLRAGEPVSVDTSQPTVMAGLNCGTVSSLAWPVLESGLDAAVTVTDAEALAAMDELHGQGIDVGPCGAASLAGLRAALTELGGAGEAGGAGALGLDADSHIVLLSTESAAANEVSARERPVRAECPDPTTGRTAGSS